MYSQFINHLSFGTISFMTTFYVFVVNVGGWVGGRACVCACEIPKIENPFLEKTIAT